MSVRTLRAAGRSAGGSSNDAFLAALAGGMRRYHEAQHHPVDLLPFGIPVSTRSSDTSGGQAGNRFAGIRLAAPVGEKDPAERIRIVHAAVDTARSEAALDAVTMFAPVLAALPARLIARAGRMQDALDVQASYVPGPGVPIYLAGVQARTMYAFGPSPGPALMALLVTYQDSAHVAFTIDTAAVTDVVAFEASMRAGFDEVLALAGDEAGIGHEQ